MELREIMLIEDNPDDGEVIIRGFRECDPDKTIAWYKTSKEALESLEKGDNNNPQLIILDLNLPGMDGRDLLAHIKESDTLKEIPVVILTTSIDRNDIKHCYTHGANSYIQKPVNFYQMKDFCKNISQYWFQTCVLPATINYDA